MKKIIFKFYIITILISTLIGCNLSLPTDDSTTKPDVIPDVTYIIETSWYVDYPPINRYIKLDSDNIYMIGQSNWVTDPCNFVIEKRKKADGKLINNFGSGGVLKIYDSNTITYSRHLGIDNNYIYLTGDYSASQFFMEKRDKNTGALISGFGTNGVLLFDKILNGGSIEKFVIDNSYIYIAATAEINSTNSQVIIQKRNLSDGSLVVGFEEHSVTDVSYTPTAIEGTIQSNYSDKIITIKNFLIYNNNIYLVEYYDDDVLSERVYLVEKRNINTGVPLNTFGVNGILTLPDNKSYIDFTIDNSSIYITSENYDNNYNGIWIIEKRSITNGELDAAFGTNGIISVNLGIDELRPELILNNQNNIYIAGSDNLHGSNNNQWRLENRNKLNGNLITDFGDESISDGINTQNHVDGVIQSNPSSKEDELRMVEIDNNYIYMIGMSWTESFNYGWRLEKRRIDTGKF